MWLEWTQLYILTMTGHNYHLAFLFYTKITAISPKRVRQLPILIFFGSLEKGHRDYFAEKHFTAFLRSTCNWSKGLIAWICNSKYINQFNLTTVNHRRGAFFLLTLKHRKSRACDEPQLPTETRWKYGLPEIEFATPQNWVENSILAIIELY